jgi:hypothetical protein
MGGVARTFRSLVRSGSTDMFVFLSQKEPMQNRHGQTIACGSKESGPFPCTFSEWLPSAVSLKADLAESVGVPTLSLAQ